MSLNDAIGAETNRLEDDIRNDRISILGLLGVLGLPDIKNYERVKSLAKSKIESNRTSHEGNKPRPVRKSRK